MLNEISTNEVKWVDTIVCIEAMTQFIHIRKLCPRWMNSHAIDDLWVLRWPTWWASLSRILGGIFVIRSCAELSARKLCKKSARKAATHKLQIDEVMQSHFTLESRRLLIDWSSASLCASTKHNTTARPRNYSGAVIMLKNHLDKWGESHAQKERERKLNFTKLILQFINDRRS